MIAEGKCVLVVDEDEGERQQETTLVLGTVWRP
jgi:hypothetical protein